MAKTYPSNWITRQIAYFAGILSFHIANREGVEAIGRILDERAAAQTQQVYFSDLVEHLEPLISADKWAGCVANCEKIFGKVL
jgi:hypothetical protein